jgi:RimJ/RimL family protein N-acetyltransferase
MEKLGMQQEALLRRHRLFRDEYIDEVWFAALRDPA